MVLEMFGMLSTTANNPDKIIYKLQRLWNDPNIQGLKKPNISRAS